MISKRNSLITQNTQGQSKSKLASISKRKKRKKIKEKDCANALYEDIYEDIDFTGEAVDAMEEEEKAIEDIPTSGQRLIC